jgi:undecaprenyl pyrophosphate phosphatase UppP
MEPIADARRELALEIHKLAEDFERDDEAAFRRTRIACWIVVAIVTIMTLGLLVIGGDARYLGVFWLIIVGLIWAGYALSSRRQRQQTGRLRALATRWLSAGQTVSRDPSVGSGVPARNEGTEL